MSEKKSEELKFLELKPGDTLELNWLCKNCGESSNKFFCPKPRCEALRRLQDPVQTQVHRWKGRPST